MKYLNIIQVMNERDRLVLRAEDEYNVKVVKCSEEPVIAAACLLYRDYFFSYEAKFLLFNDP
jgi:hypothetical protein